MTESNSTDNQNDTVFAVASGGGKAGISIVRITGPKTAGIVLSVTGSLPLPRMASYRAIRHPASREILDQGLVIWFPGPKSYTGEDCAEFQVHGGSAVVSAITLMLSLEPGLRPAHAGEFTQRAFANGKIDLSQVEGLADLIDSETEQQRKQALAQLAGVLGKKIETWRSKLVHALALLEAEIDFVEEGDAPTGILSQVSNIAALVHDDIATSLKGSHIFERIRESLVIVVCGPPNVGKSTFFNRLANREVAIVSERPGTTRDALTFNMDLNGFPVKLVDTAGLRKTRNFVESRGIERALAHIASADLVLWLFERPSQLGKSFDLITDGQVWPVQTKADLRPSAAVPGQQQISAYSGEGISELLNSIADYAAQLLGQGGEVPLTRARHRLALAETNAALQRVKSLSEPASLELVAEDLRLAVRSLGRITGQVDVEEILEEIFSKFCIGK